MTPVEWVEVWPQGRAWRWRYVRGEDGEDGEDGEHQLELPANTVSWSREDAEAAARTAYPELPVRVLADDPPAGTERPGRAAAAGRRAPGSVVAVVLVVVALAGAVLVVVVRRRGAGDRERSA